jgi:cell division protein FtsW
MVKRKNKKPDYFLLIIVIILLVVGIAVLASASAPSSWQKYGKTYHFLFHQLIYGMIPGLIVGFVAFKLNLLKLKKFAFWLLLANLFLMLLVFIPGIGIKAEGAARWVDFKLFSFQPSELLKITSILYLAAWLAGKKEKEITSKKTFLLFISILSFISIILLAQPDTSTLAVIFAVVAIMYFSSGASIFHILFLGLFGIAGILFIAKLSLYRLNRILVFLNPDIEPMGIGYQIKQSLIAIGSGGLFGAGFGMSMQKSGLLPQPIADCIFAIFSEETGFIGSFFLLVIFLLFLWRGFRISKRAENEFYQLTALGITSWITIQAFVNIGAMIGVLPLTGIPLPLISYGGSALVVNLAGIGILLNISRYSS